MYLTSGQAAWGSLRPARGGPAPCRLPAGSFNAAAQSLATPQPAAVLPALLANEPHAVALQKGTDWVT